MNYDYMKELEKFKEDVKDALQIDDDTPDNEVIEYIVEIEGEWEPPHYVNDLKKTIREQQDLMNELDEDTIMKKYRDKVNKEKAEYANKIADYLKKRHEKELLTIRKMLS